VGGSISRETSKKDYNALMGSTNQLGITHQGQYFDIQTERKKGGVGGECICVIKKIT